MRANFAPVGSNVSHLPRPLDFDLTPVRIVGRMTLHARAICSPMLTWWMTEIAPKSGTLYWWRGLADNTALGHEANSAIRNNAFSCLEV